MWSDDGFETGAVVEPLRIYGLVGFPTAARNHDVFCCCLECGNLWQLNGCLHDVGHAVKACVAGNGDIVDVDAGQELSRVLVLHINVGVTFENVAESAAKRLEKRLRLAENGRYEIGGNIAFGKLLHVVAPKLIFDKYGHFGVCQVDETACISRGVKRQIAHGIDFVVVFAHFIARWREESEQYLAVGILTANFLNQGTALLKFA